MRDTHFRFSTEIIRRLGEELNPTHDRGILELVKNAYDADARTCTVELLDTDEPGGTVRVTDDGDGMVPRDIRDKWLVLGRSSKTKGQTTRLGRIPAGSKGLGRLAALRMGERASLETRPRGKTQQHAVSIDWRRFDRANLVEDVPLEIDSKPRAQRGESGSTVEISGLKAPIKRMEVKRLARELLLLADPFGVDPSSFTPRLLSDDFEDLTRLVDNSYFAEADYALVASVDSRGRAKVKVTDWRGRELFKAGHKELTVHREGRPYICKGTAFRFWTFLLSGESFQLRSVTLGEVRKWLEQFSGVHLYENGLRVSPYGDPGNDWLDMNVRRARSPEERPSTNNSIGHVAVTDPSDLLVQKTDRSGFIETDYFREIREFATNCLDWMARRRLEVAERRRQKERAEQPRRVRKSKVTLDQAIEALPQNKRKEVEGALSAYDRSRDREVETLKKEVQLYRTLSTAGITAATFAHESAGNPLKVIVHSIRAIERRGKKLAGQEYSAQLEQPVSTVQRAIKSLAVLGEATLQLVDHDKRRVGRVDVHRVIKGVATTFAPFLDGRDVSLSLTLCSGAPYLRGTEAALESIFTNLLNNSLTAFERGGAGKRQIWVSTEVESTTVFLQVSDNGPGIEGIELRDIWLPGRSTQPNGTGLGLVIVKDSVRDLGGSVDAVAHGARGGAEFRVELPIIGA